MDDTKKRTLREIKSIIEYLREQKGAISVEVGDIKASFLPKEVEQSKQIIETISTVVNAGRDIEADNAVKKEEEANNVRLDPDLFASS